MISPLRELLSDVKVILASTSPQRKHILEQIKIPFDVQPSLFNEETVDKLSYSNPKDYVKFVAHNKAISVAKLHRLSTKRVLVIGADTVIVHNEKIIGKPHKPDIAKETLNLLSNKTHKVCTGVAVIYILNGKFSEIVFEESTHVEFGNLSSYQIDSYIETGEPLNKAGAYGIQGLGAMLVKKIEGDYNNVVGFPVYKFGQELSKFLRAIKNTEN